MSFFDKLFSYIVCDMDLLCDLHKLFSYVVPDLY